MKLTAFAVAAIGALGLATGDASAAKILTSFSGTITRGTDTFGYFGLGGQSDLTGLDVIVEFVHDSDRGIVYVEPGYNARNGATEHAAIRMNDKIYDISTVGSSTIAKRDNFGGHTDELVHNAHFYETDGAYYKYEDLFASVFESRSAFELWDSSDVNASLSALTMGADAFGSFILSTNPEDGPVALDGEFVINRVSVRALSAVPEPHTWAMMLGGLATAGATLRRRSRDRVAL